MKDSLLYIYLLDYGTKSIQWSVQYAICCLCKHITRIFMGTCLNEVCTMFSLLYTVHMTNKQNETGIKSLRLTWTFQISASCNKRNKHKSKDFKYKIFTWRRSHRHCMIAWQHNCTLNDFLGIDPNQLNHFAFAAMTHLELYNFYWLLFSIGKFIA